MKKLKFGIEIIAAMKASCYDCDIETGRIMALENTEPNLVEGYDYENCNEEEKDVCRRIAKHEKEVLHKQALYVSDIALKYIENETEALRAQLEACKDFIKAITVVRKGELININVSVENMGESYDKLRELYKKTGV